MLVVGNLAPVPGGSPRAVGFPGVTGGVRGDEITRLALAAAAGDHDAKVRFIHATQRDVLRFVAGLVGQREAEDLAQETYLRALRSLPNFAGRSSARTWLLSIARRAAADHVRAAVRRPRISSAPDWEQAMERNATMPGVEDRVMLRELLLGLEPDRREAFVLTQILDLSYADAAAVCGCPIGTIRSRVARARAELVTGLDAGSVPDPVAEPKLDATGP
jgi:RNA polymerase sigma-70 factor (ECF subfamily)